MGDPVRMAWADFAQAHDDYADEDGAERPDRRLEDEYASAPAWVDAGPTDADRAAELAALPTAERLDMLARTVARLEGRPTHLRRAAGDEESLPAVRPSFLDASSGESAVLPLGIPALDRRLGGGLARAGLHEIRGAETRDAGAALGFAAAILARLTAADPRPLLWITETAAGHEAGLPYGPGLAQFGLDPERLVFAEVRRAVDGLWVFEEGLRCRGLAGVIAELRGNPAALDLTASRRLALRATESGVTGLLLRQAGSAEPGAALTRFQVAPRRGGAAPFSFAIGRPAWRLALERNRFGPLATFDLEWDHDHACFRELPAERRRVARPIAARPAAGPATVLPLQPALPVAVPAEAGDRPAAPGGGGAGLAERLAG